MTEFTQLYLSPKIFLLGSSLAFSLKEDPVRCAKVCDKSWVILMTGNEPRYEPMAKSIGKGFFLLSFYFLFFFRYENNDTYAHTFLTLIILAIGTVYYVQSFVRILISNFIMGQFFCVGLGFMFHLLCLDSCLQTYVLRKIKTSRFMLCLSQNIT